MEQGIKAVGNTKGNHGGAKCAGLAEKQGAGKASVCEKGMASNKLATEQ